MAYTVDELSTKVDALTTRLAALDGQGLASPAIALTDAVGALTVRLTDINDMISNPDTVLAVKMNTLIARVGDIDSSLTDPNTILAIKMSALNVRVAALDGQGLPDPTLAFTTVISRRVRGVETSLKQYVLTIDGQFKDLNATIDMLTGALNSLGKHPRLT